MPEFSRMTPGDLGKLQLKEMPFRISADPRFLYLSEDINRMINRLLDLMEFEEGLAVVSGEIGGGKTSVARRLFEIARGEDNNLHPVFIHTATYSTAGVAAKEISKHLGAAPKRSYTDQLHAIEDWINDIREQGLNPVLIIDDAHNMSVDSLDTIQNLINFDAKSKAVQIVLFGQPEIHKLFGHKAAKSVNKRIVTWELLRPFKEGEMIEMLNWRVQIAGRTTPLFDLEAFKSIYKVSEGNPRDSVNIANQALHLLLQTNNNSIDLETSNKAISAFLQRPVTQTAEVTP